MENLVAENPGIGLYSETGLHGALKARYAAAPGARVEVKVAGRVVDVVLPGEFVEIQTRSLGSIATKIMRLACVGPVRVVHPIAVSTTIRRIDPESGELQSDRRSNARRDLYSAFDELVRATDLVASPNVTLDFVLVKVVETRMRDVSRSWRRRGDRVLARELDEILETRCLESRRDWLGLIPPTLAQPYDSEILGKALGIHPLRARNILYTYCRAGLLVEAGSRGRRKQYEQTG